MLSSFMVVQISFKRKLESHFVGYELCAPSTISFFSNGCEALDCVTKELLTIERLSTTIS